MRFHQSTVAILIGFFGGSLGIPDLSAQLVRPSATNPTQGAILRSDAAITRLDDATPPANVTAVPGVTSISLSWSLVVGASGYRVTRAPQSGGEYVSLTPSLITNTSYTDIAFSPNGAYSYQVTAVRPDGHWGTSSPVSVTAKPPLNPANFRATPGGNGVTLSWSAMPDVRYYLLQGTDVAAVKVVDTTYTVRDLSWSGRAPLSWTVVSYYEGAGQTFADGGNPSKANISDVCYLGYNRATDPQLSISNSLMGNEYVVVSPGDTRAFLTDWKYHLQRNDGQNYYGSHLRDAKNLGTRTIMLQVRYSPLSEGWETLEPGDLKYLRADLMRVQCQ